MASKQFSVVEATIGGIHAAYRDGSLSARQLVAMYLERIDAYDRHGPAINSLTNVNRAALVEADRLDAALKTSGITGPLRLVQR